MYMVFRIDNRVFRINSVRLPYGQRLAGLAVEEGLILGGSWQRLAGYGIDQTPLALKAISEDGSFDLAALYQWAQVFVSIYTEAVPRKGDDLHVA